MERTWLAQDQITDRDNSLAFWGQVAATFKEYPNVLFDVQRAVTGSMRRWDRYDRVGHSASNPFRACGVKPGDFVYIVAVRNARLYVGTRVKVKAGAGQHAAVRRCGELLLLAIDLPPLNSSIARSTV
jgi:hypothetical protein